MRLFLRFSNTVILSNFCPYLQFCSFFKVHFVHIVQFRLYFQFCDFPSLIFIFLLFLIPGVSILVVTDCIRSVQKFWAVHDDHGGSESAAMYVIFPAIDVVDESYLSLVAQVTNFSCLFTFNEWMSAVCLYLLNDFQLFVYNCRLFCLHFVPKFSCLFT